MSVCLFDRLTLSKSEAIYNFGVAEDAERPMMVSPDVKMFTSE